MMAQILIRIVGNKRSKSVQLLDFAQIDRTVLSIKVVQDKDRFFFVLPYISVYLIMLFEDRYKTSSGNSRMVFSQADQLFIMIENRILVFQRFLHIDLAIVRIGADPWCPGREACIVRSIPLHRRTRIIA